MKNLYFQETDTDTIAVYEILCLQTGRRYIGSSKNVRVRWRGHAFALAANNHTCEGLQNDYNSGYDFIFSVIQSFDIISKKELLEKEAAEISMAEYLYKYAPPTGSHTNADVYTSRYYRKNRYYIESGHPVKYPKKTGKPPIWKLWKGNQISD